MTMYSVAMVWAAVCLVGSAQARQQDNPYADHTVLVESFMVELTTEAVREAGADIVDRDPDGISITKLLWALRDEDNGHVESGLKINAGHGQRDVRAQEEITHYYSTVRVLRSDVPPQTHRQSYQSSRSLLIDRFNIISDSSVRLNYIYSENTVIPSETDVPPAIAKTTFTGSLTARPGVPVIAGASQNEYEVRLLVFVVTVTAPDVAVEDEPTKKVDALQPTVTFSERLSAVDALRMVGEMYKVNIILSPGVMQNRRPVPILHLYDVTFEEVLEAIVDDFHYIIDGKFIRIYTAEEFAEMQKDTPEDTPEVAPQVAPEPAVDAPAQGLRHEDRRRDDR